MHASQNIQIFTTLCNPETQLRHQQGSQPARALTGSISFIQITIMTVHKIKHQKSVHTKKLEESTKWFSEAIKQIIQLFHHYLRQSFFGKHPKIGSKLASD